MYAAMLHFMVMQRSGVFRSALCDVRVFHGSPFFADIVAKRVHGDDNKLKYAFCLELNNAHKNCNLSHFYSSLEKETNNKPFKNVLHSNHTASPSRMCRPP